MSCKNGLDTIKEVGGELFQNAAPQTVPDKIKEVGAELFQNASPKTVPDKIKEVVGAELFQMAELETADISFSQEVIAACKANYCGKYNKCWTCPPAIGDINTLKKKYLAYGDAVVYTTMHHLEDSFDFEGMMSAKVRHGEIDRELLARLDSKTTAILGIGGCHICEKCTYPDAPCRFPALALPSLEGCGIDVVALAKTACINYHNGANTVTYFSLICYKKQSAILG